MRHMALHYEFDRCAHTLKYHYLYGRDLLVAPVLKKGKKTWKVYLPDDEWTHLWSGKQHTKGWCRVPAPLGEPPVFYRKDSSFAELFASFKKS